MMVSAIRPSLRMSLTTTSRVGYKLYDSFYVCSIRNTLDTWQYVYIMYNPYTMWCDVMSCDVMWTDVVCARHSLRMPLTSTSRSETERRDSVGLYSQNDALLYALLFLHNTIVSHFIDWRPLYASEFVDRFKCGQPNLPIPSFYNHVSEFIF
jgi:hypothetical protein